VESDQREGLPGYCMLTDFGISQALDKQGIYKGSSGTLGYMPPEMFSKDKAHGPPADWFAAGVTLHRMVTGISPMNNDKPKRIHGKRGWSGVKFPAVEVGKSNSWGGKASEETIKKRGDKLKPEVKDLIEKLCQLDPQKRPNLQEIRDHAAFGHINWGDLNKCKIPPPFVPKQQANFHMHANDMDMLGGGGGNEITPEENPQFTVKDEEQSKFDGYDWNIDCAALTAGKREVLESVGTVRRASLMAISDGDKIFDANKSTTKSFTKAPTNAMLSPDDIAELDAEIKEQEGESKADEETKASPP
jgi:serine/threonine protein kinase